MATDTLIYHLYPLGLCGATARNTGGEAVPRLEKLYAWIAYLADLGVSSVYWGPIFESGSHGYDTSDYFHLDRRLGTDETLKAVIAAFHARGLRVIVDGVFNHVGRDFWAFRDVREKGLGSRYSNWFCGLKSGTTPYGDPFTYDTWNGCYELVKLNTSNPEVRNHLFDAVRWWKQEFNIDGLRLDAADVLDLGFQKALRNVCRVWEPDFLLLGEVIHGDYRLWANPETLHTVTNYEVYKGLYSSHNDKNYFEIAWSLNRQFGPEGLYRNFLPYNFADNHDVNRVASTLHEKAHLYPLYLLLLTIPGLPSLYYGSEAGLTGVKTQGLEADAPLRPALDSPEELKKANQELTAALQRLIRLRAEHKGLRQGNYRELAVRADLLAFERWYGEENVIVVSNARAEAQSVHLTNIPSGQYRDALNGDELFFAEGDQLVIDKVWPFWGRVLVKN